ncbi:hypothetical protein [Alkaliphilus hydrothermalis]|uniref:Uncharacterized protein n=1 Tax=Alkaliphilus hydrothermalis TaxID=1482730 RepID=A0ABS2NNM5_9FIRM|nr:hypothetical protein [Alkaliphilus hydrothermalis]MBM7614509.1 hypothetical protein [Alkaliphilus hydrothermalis]
MEIVENATAKNAYNIDTRKSKGFNSINRTNEHKTVYNGINKEF